MPSRLSSQSRLQYPYHALVLLKIIPPPEAYFFEALNGSPNYTLLRSDNLFHTANDWMLLLLEARATNVFSLNHLYVSNVCGHY